MSNPVDHFEPPIQYDPVPVNEPPRVEDGFVTTHPPAPNYGPDTLTGGDPSQPMKGLVPSGKERFPANEQWVDLPWGIAFLVHTAAFYGLIIWQAAKGCTKALEHLFDKDSDDDFHLKFSDVFIFMGMALICAACVSAMILIISRKYAKQFMWFGLGIQAAIAIACIVFAVIWKNLFLGIFGGVFLLLVLLQGWLFRNSIGLAAALLQGAGVAVRKNWGMLMVTFGYALNVIVALGTGILWLCACWYALDEKRFPDNYSPGFGYFFLIWGCLAYLWIDNVFLNVLHTTCCGSCARLFYLGERQQPPNPTVVSYQLASTKYFGASAFGGFLMAVVTWLRIMMEAARDQAAADGNIAGALLACCCACFLSCIEEFVRIVNQYAMVYVSMYGNGFWKSGKMVFKLMGSTGLEPLFNDWALSLFWMCSVLCSALLCLGILGGLSAAMFDHMSIFNLLKHDQHIPIELIIMYATAAIVCGVLTAGAVQPLDSGARTLLVLFMEAPAYFYQSQPEVYEHVRDRAARMGLVDKAPAHFIYN